MPQEPHTEIQPSKRRTASGRRFWFIVLAGTLAAYSYEIVPLLMGDFSAAKKLVLPTLLLVWLYRGSEWARWIWMVLLLIFGILNMVLGLELLLYTDHWWPVYIFSSIMVATALYMAFAKRDFARYCNYVVMRNGRRADARRAEGKS